LVVDIPPCADLPQHAAQARLFFETLGAGDTPYRIQWLTPYGLSYVPLLLLWLVLPPLAAAKLHLLVIALGCTAAIHALAAHKGRPPEAAALASLFVFSLPLYWGFLSFLVGFPAFVLWIVVVERERRRDALVVLGAALLLYLCHALWFLAGAAYLGVRMLVARRLRVEWPRIVALLPILALGVWQSGRFASDRFATRPFWDDWPLTRLAGFVDAALGGLRDPIEIVVVVAAAAWILVGLARRRDLDRDLALAGGLFVVFFAVLPMKYLNTVSFAQRWLPFALALLVLAVPAPPARAALRNLAVAALVVAFSAITTASWRAFQRIDLDGLEEALAALPDRPRVLGLDYVQHRNQRFKPRVTLQTFAYAQVLHGGRVSFSFAEHPASLVVYDKPFRPPWTDGLEWWPTRFQPSDVQYFDFVLVSDDHTMHDVFAGALRAVTHEGRWRLYAVPR